MAIGPGKYDKLCSIVRRKARAEGAFVIVIGGKNGDGFSAQAPMHILKKLPAVLRDMARQIEGDTPHLKRTDGQLELNDYGPEVRPHSTKSWVPSGSDLPLPGDK